MYGILCQTNFCGQKDSSIPQCTKNRKKHAITINKGMLAQYFFYFRNWCTMSPLSTFLLFASTMCIST